MTLDAACGASVCESFDQSEGEQVERSTASAGRAKRQQSAVGGVGYADHRSSFWRAKRGEKRSPVPPPLMLFPSFGPEAELQRGIGI